MRKIFGSNEMYGGAFYPLSRRSSLSEMEEYLNRLKRLQSEFEKKLDESEGKLDDSESIQNDVYAFALYQLWAAFSESMQASGSVFDLESEFDAYALEEATKYEREVRDRFGL